MRIPQWRNEPIARLGTIFVCICQPLLPYRGAREDHTGHRTMCPTYHVAQVGGDSPEPKNNTRKVPNQH